MYCSIHILLLSCNGLFGDWKMVAIVINQGNCGFFSIFVLVAFCRITLDCEYCHIVFTKWNRFDNEHRIFFIILVHYPYELLLNCLIFRNHRQPNRGVEATFSRPYLAATSTLGIITEWKIIRGRYRVQILKHTFRIVRTRYTRLVDVRESLSGPNESCPIVPRRTTSKRSTKAKLYLLTSDFK